MSWARGLDLRTEPFRRMVTIGASITAGGAATARSQCWASVLADLISQYQDEPVQLINVGIGANVISARSVGYAASRRPSALERYRRDVIVHTPDLTVIDYGLSDVFCGTPVCTFAEDMEQLISALQNETQSVIVLVGVYAIPRYDTHGPVWDKGSQDTVKEYNGAQRRIAKDHRLLFVDLFAMQDMAMWILDADGLHANNLGHRLIAHRIFEALACHCSILARRANADAACYTPWRDESALCTESSDPRV